MKIIGETAEGFLLSATQNEVANLEGHYCYASAQSLLQAPKCGHEINLHKVYSTFYELGKQFPNELNCYIQQLEQVVKYFKEIKESKLVKEIEETSKDFKGFK